MSFGGTPEQKGVCRRLLTAGLVATALAPLGLFATATAAFASTTATSLSFSTQPSPTYAGRDTVVVSVLAASGPNPMSGTVTIGDSFDDLDCTVVLSESNQASCQSPDSEFTTTGSDTISASYGGTSSFGSSSANTTITVAKASTTLSANATAATVGETTTVTVQASPSLTGNTAGTLSVTDTAGALSCSTTIANGTSAQCTSSVFSAITDDSITVTWLGNSDYNAASTSTTLDVGQSSTVVESVTASPTQVGQTATITAQVEPHPDGGYVEITDADDQVTACTSVAVDTATGEATCVTNTLTTADASDTMSATYLGDANYAASTATPGTLDVQRGSTQLVVSADPAPSAGSTATYVATVSPTTAASGGGTVSFSDTANEITDCSSQALSSSSSTASCTSLTYASVGSDQVTASYVGSANWAPSSSSASFTVAQGSPNVSITVSPSSPTVSETATITAVVSPTDGGGTVDFSGSYLGSDCSAVPLTGDSASCTTSTLTSVGSSSVNVAYSGDSNYYSVGPDSTTLHVAQAPTTVVVTASTPSPYAFAADTLTATVSPVPDGGTVSFTSSGSAISGCTGVAVSTTTGEAQCAIAALPGAGSYAATASYSGDTNYAGYAGQLSLAIAKIPTSIVVSPSPDPVTVGQTTTLTVTVAPVPDGGTVTVTDTDGDLTCSAISVATSGAGAGTASCSTRALSPAGSDSLNAFFSGTSNYTAASASSSITVSRIASTTSVSTEDAFGVVGEELHVAVVVSPIPASGTVDFSDALNQLELCASVPVNSSTGIASCTSGALTRTGPDLITATLQQTATEASSSVATTIPIDEQPAFDGSLTINETAGSVTAAAIPLSGYPAPTVSSTAALPSGLTLNANGTITGTPAYGSGGVYSIPITATNSLSSVSATATIVVGQVPAVTSPTQLSAAYGAESTFQVETAAGTYPTATFALSGATPAGMTFTDNGDGTATISGTPSNYVSGTQTFKLLVANSVGSILVPIMIDVTGTPSPPSPGGGTTTVVTTTTSTTTSGDGSNSSTLSPLQQALQAHDSAAVPSAGVEPKVTEKGALPATYDPITRTRVVRKGKSKVTEPIVTLGMDTRFPSLGNDGPYGDCAVVADSNIVRVDHILGKVKSVPSMTTNEALSEWSAINGGTGTGLTDVQFLHAWSGSGGLLGTRIRGWRLLDPQNVTALKRAIKASGAIYAGIVLPSAGIVGTTIDPALTANSQVAGHGLTIFGWTPSGFLGISWGEVVLLPYSWWTQFSTTAYAVNVVQKTTHAKATLSKTVKS